MAVDVCESKIRHRMVGRDAPADILRIDDDADDAELVQAMEFGWSVIEKAFDSTSMVGMLAV